MGVTNLAYLLHYLCGNQIMVALFMSIEYQGIEIALRIHKYVYDTMLSNSGWLVNTWC